MKELFKTTIAPAAALFATAFVAMSTPAAAASPDYCRLDYASAIRGCGYASLEQCQATTSGRGGSCTLNPFGSGSTYAYELKSPGSKTLGKPAANR
jgi:hypothetical protein